MSTVRLLQVGVGPLGVMMARSILERSADVRLVGAVDIDTAVIGREIGELTGSGRNTGIIVRGSLEDAVRESDPDVALLTTVSDMEWITPQILEIVKHGVDVVSTCEELAYPWQTAPVLAERLNAAALEADATVLGTGVNPGFLMDCFPILLTAVCQRVDRIRISRIQDARHRRIPFQRKIGAGLTLEEFEAKRAEGTLRHVGLTESMQMIAGRMGWDFDSTEDTLTPVVADRPIETEAVKIEAGMAAGVQQVGKGIVDGEELVTLVFRASVGESDPRDTIEIFGKPDIVSEVPGGVNGDIATCAITVNAASRIGQCRPGLKTMVDIPLVSA